MRFATPVLVLSLLLPLAAAADVPASGGVAAVFLSRPVLVPLDQCVDPSRAIEDVVAVADAGSLRWALQVEDRETSIRCAGGVVPGAVAVGASLQHSNVGVRFDVQGGGAIRSVSHHVAEAVGAETRECVLFTFANGTSAGDCWVADADPIEPVMVLALTGTTPGQRAIPYDLTGATLSYIGFAVAAYRGHSTVWGFVSVAQSAAPGTVSG